jgi:recombination endonuclease VII
MDQLKHGKASTYNNHKCRCKPCRAAWAEYMAPRVQAHRRGEKFTLRDEDWLSLKARYSKLLEYQNGVCAICKEAPNGKKLALDHDHTTGEIRGLLCSSCNWGIGWLKDNTQTLKLAIQYLENPPNRGAKIYL